MNLYANWFGFDIKKNDYVLCLFEYNMSYTREGVQIAVAQE